MRTAPNDELATVRAMPAAQIRRSVTMRVWCHTGKCQVARVFSRREGSLVEMGRASYLGADDIGDLRVKAPTFWVEEVPDDEMDIPIAISCECSPQEDHWSITYGDIVTAVHEGRSNLGVSRKGPS